MIFDGGLIIGGGLDGLILNRCLLKEGIDSLVFEAKPGLYNSVETPVIVWPQAAEILRNISSEVSADTRHVKLQGINYYKFDGTPIASLKLPETAKFLAYERNHLADLLGTNCEIGFDKRFERFGDTPDVVKAYFDDGSFTSGRFLVGCDGVNSKVRKQVQREADLTYRGFNQWMGVIEDSGVVLSPEIHIYSSFGVHFGMLPLHNGKIGWWVQIKDSDENDEKVSERAEKIFDFIGHWKEPISYLVQNTPAIEKVKGFDRRVTKSWHWGNSGLVGHAAHPMLPFLNMGLNLSISECEILSKLLATKTLPSQAFMDLEKRFFRKAIGTRNKITRNTNRLLADGFIGEIRRIIALQTKAAIGRI